jgi:serine phosphatase RsbU (regulator of sigma subunit)/ligand-binding sensor domain-containing protein
MLGYIHYRIWICAAAILLFVLPAQGQHRSDRVMHLHSLGITDGLSQGMIFCMFQDSRGFMWFGTKEGLNRYDGHTFQVHRKRPGDSVSLQENYVYAITEDEQGRLWIGTGGGGLIMFEPNREHFTQVPLYYKDSDIPVRIIDDLEIDSKGRLWISVQGSSLLRVNTRLADPKAIAKSAYHGGPVRYHPSREVDRLHRDRLGRLTYITEAGLYHLNEEKGKWMLTVDCARLFGDMPEWGPITSAAVHSDGSIWLALNMQAVSQLVHLTADGKKILSSRSFIVGEEELYIRDLLGGPNGVLYILAFNYFVRYDTVRDSYIAVRADKERNASYIGKGNHLFQSRGGMIWISTSGHGLNTYDPLTLSFNARTGGMNEALFGVEADAFDRFIRARTDGFTGLVNDIYPIRLKDGSVWCGTRDHGLLHYNATTRRVRQFGVVSGDPYSGLMIRLQRPFVDSRGRVWVGNRYGISRLDVESATWHHYWYDQGAPDLTNADDHITSYHEAPDGTFWLGTMMRGVARFFPDSGHFTFYMYDQSDSTSISHNHVLSIEADPQHGDRFLWIGTDGGGLNRFDLQSQEFMRFGIRHGLPNAVVYGILTDAAGYLWMSTNEGLCRMDTRTETFRCYDVRDGLQGNEFNRTQYQKVGDSLCFGGVDGYNLFLPSDIRENSTVPSIVLTGLRLFNTPVYMGSPGSPLSVAIPYTTELHLFHDQNMISIQFAALDYHAPDRNQYRYRLEGFTEGWIEAGTDRVATFTNLDPGEYVFQVVGSNNHGVWNTTGVSLRIVIDPPWWMTMWAFAVYAFLLIGSLFTVDRIQKRRLIARERQQSQFRETQLRAEAAELEARAVRAENEKKNKEMQVASAIQQRVLPQQLPRIPGYDLAGINLPADEVGGDYYDIIALHDGRVVMVIADVTGKGVAASLLVNGLHAALRVRLEYEMDTVTLIRHLNEYLYKSTPPNAFVTFLIAVLDPATGDLEIVNAGHNPALLHRNGSVRETLRSQHLPLGCAVSTTPYHSEHYVLEPGQGLLLFTDGITEAMNVDFEPFGQEPLEKLVTMHRTQPAAMLLGLIVAELQHYARNAEQSDDITALYIRRDPAAGE